MFNDKDILSRTYLSQNNYGIQKQQFKYLNRYIMHDKSHFYMKEKENSAENWYHKFKF